MCYEIVTRTGQDCRGRVGAAQYYKESILDNLCQRRYRGLRILLIELLGKKHIINAIVREDGKAIFPIFLLTK